MERYWCLYRAWLIFKRCHKLKDEPAVICISLCPLCYNCFQKWSVELNIQDSDPFAGLLFGDVLPSTFTTMFSGSPPWICFQYPPWCKRKKDISSASWLITSHKIWTQEATDTVWQNCDKHQMFPWAETPVNQVHTPRGMLFFHAEWNESCVHEQIVDPFLVTCLILVMKITSKVFCIKVWFLGGMWECFW